MAVRDFNLAAVLLVCLQECKRFDSVDSWNMSQDEGDDSANNHVAIGNSSPRQEMHNIVLLCA